MLVGCEEIQSNESKKPGKAANTHIFVQTFSCDCKCVCTQHVVTHVTKADPENKSTAESNGLNKKKFSHPQEIEKLFNSFRNRKPKIVDGRVSTDEI